MTTKHKKTLNELRETIAEYGPLVGTPADQFAHNVVSMSLSIIADRYGKAAAHEAIDDYDLKAKGWCKHEEATNE